MRGRNTLGVWEASRACVTRHNILKRAKRKKKDELFWLPGNDNSLYPLPVNANTGPEYSSFFILIILTNMKWSMSSIQLQNGKLSVSHILPLKMLLILYKGSKVGFGVFMELQLVFRLQRPALLEEISALDSYMGSHTCWALSHPQTPLSLDIVHKSPGIFPVQHWQPYIEGKKEESE